MKSTSAAIGCFLAALLVAGCEMDAFTSSRRSPGKPVVVLASVSEASGSSRDLSPVAPYKIPDYPAPLLQAGVEGFVDVRLGIRPDGSVDTAAVLKSTEKDFEGPVLAAVKTWQFAQLRREKADASRDVEIVCRLRFSIEYFWRDSMGSGLGEPSEPRGGVTSTPPRSQVLTPR
jgi:TonB family protein